MSDWFYRNVLAVDWHSVFDPQVALLEIVLRGTLVYLVLFAMLRLTRRQAGQIGTSDVLLIVLIADAIQNAMASEYHSLTAGFTLAFTIWFWSWFLDFLAFRFTVLRPLIIATRKPLSRMAASTTARCGANS